jgi:hypothetical protein
MTITPAVGYLLVVLLLRQHGLCPRSVKVRAGEGCVIAFVVYQDQ